MKAFRKLSDGVYLIECVLCSLEKSRPMEAGSFLQQEYLRHTFHRIFSHDEYYHGGKKCILYRNRHMLKGFTLQLSHYLEDWIYWPFTLSFANCLWRFFALYTRIWVFLFLFFACFCCIVSFIVYFIFSSERKVQELHFNMWEKGRMRCIFNS